MTPMDETSENHGRHRFRPGGLQSSAPSALPPEPPVFNRLVTWLIIKGHLVHSDSNVVRFDGNTVYGDSNVV